MAVFKAFYLLRGVSGEDRALIAGSGIRRNNDLILTYFSILVFLLRSCLASCVSRELVPAVCVCSVRFLAESTR